MVKYPNINKWLKPKSYKEIEDNLLKLSFKEFVENIENQCFQINYSLFLYTTIDISNVLTIKMVKSTIRNEFNKYNPIVFTKIKLFIDKNHSINIIPNVHNNVCNVNFEINQKFINNWSLNTKFLNMNIIIPTVKK